MENLSTITDILKRKAAGLIQSTQKTVGSLFRHPEGYINPNDYETKLNVQDENLYKDWLRLKNKNRQAAGMKPDSGYDYDTRGYWKENVGLNPSGKKWMSSLDPKAHGPDKFKKPNHPTFSTDSIYHGKNGHQGGVWGKNTFTPSPEMKKRTSKQGLFKYFKEREPEVELVWTD